MTLNTPWAPDPSCYGAVSGSAPAWQHANMHDRGRAHIASAPSELGSSGFQNWERSAAPAEPGRRHINQPSSSTYAEPTVVGAHSSYYTRRDDQGSACAFRRSSRHIPEPLHPDRPEGKRFIPVPYGPPPQPRGTRPLPDEVTYHQSASAPEPGLPRLGRYSGIDGLRCTDQEMPFEQAIGRKVRVGQHTYNGRGRAGDMSLVYGAPKRPEDDSTFFRSLKDSPTFTRFVNSLPAKPVVSPHQRRADGSRRAEQAEREREKGLVAALTTCE